MMEYTEHVVERDAYAEALGIALPETEESLQLDARGYAPAVAEELGEPYMDNLIVIGEWSGPFQLDRANSMLAHEPYDVVNDLIAAVYQTDLPLYASADDPVVLWVRAEFDSDETLFTFETTPVYNEEMQQLTAVDAVQDEIAALDANTLRDGNIEQLTSTAAYLRERFGPLEDVDASFVSEARTTTNSFAFNSANGSGYVFAADPPIIVTVGDAEVPVPYRFDSREYDLVTDTERVLEILAEADYLRIDGESVLSSMYAMGEELLEEELRGVEFFRAMNDAGTSAEYEALNELLLEKDVTLRSPVDRVKIDHLAVRGSAAVKVLDAVTAHFTEIVDTAVEAEDGAEGSP